jgi:HipA-like protein
MPSAGFLHLTDLHQGLSDQAWMGPSVKHAFFEDLARLHEKAGPWDLVLFTGDLTQRGKREEMDRLTDTLEALWRRLEQLGSRPILVAVPGNHDLVRPARSPLLVSLRHWGDDPDVGRMFWEDGENDLRTLVDEAFRPFTAWLAAWEAKHPIPPDVTWKKGLLPGDASVVLGKEGLMIGVAGLNSAFLQLEGGDYEKRLVLDPRQLNALCGGDPPEWAAGVDVALLLSHHPTAWLAPKAHEAFREHIAPPGRFLAHLFGHMHEPRTFSQREGGAPEERALQGASLFGLETWGDGTQERIHGYSAGRVEIEGAQGTLRIWPRVLVKKSAGHRLMQADPSYVLDPDEAVTFPFTPRVRAGAAEGKGGAGASAASPAEARREVEIQRYREAILAGRLRYVLLWRELGLAEPPELGQFLVFPAVEAIAPVARPDAHSDDEARAPRAPRPPSPPEPVNRVLLDPARPWVFLTGGPGAGKTTLTEWLLLTLATPDESHATSLLPGVVPVRILLRHFAAWQSKAPALAGSFFDYLDAEHDAHCRIRRADLESLAEARRLVWIFDGLDEVVDDEARDRCAGMIAGIKQRYGGRGLVTSRPLGAERAHWQFADLGISGCRMLDFDEDRIKAWVKRWHDLLAQSDAKAATARPARLVEAAKAHTAIRELCQKPLLLTLIAALTRSGDLPERRADLYGGVVLMLADEWEAPKGLEAGSSARFGIALKEKFLRALAWQMLEKFPNGSGNVVSEKDLEDFAASFCEAELSESHLIARRSARHLVGALRERNGILVCHGGDQFGFLHRALLDFLAAEEIAERVRRGQWGVAELGALLAEHIWAPPWRECLVLLVGQLANSHAEIVVQAMQGLIQRSALEEREAVALTMSCILWLTECKYLDKDPLRTFAVRLTELLRCHSLESIDSFAALGENPPVLDFLREIGPRWPGSSVLRTWALEGRTEKSDARYQGTLYALAITTAPVSDRLPLLLQLMAVADDPHGAASAVYEFVRQADLVPNDLDLILSRVEQRGERFLVEAARYPATLRYEPAIDRLLQVMRAGTDSAAKLEAATCLLGLSQHENWPPPWQGEAYALLPTLTEACGGPERMTAEFYLDVALSEERIPLDRVRAWLGSPDPELQEIAAGLLAKRGDAEAIRALERHIRSAQPYSLSTARPRLESVAVTSATAREAIKRILDDQACADIEQVLDLARWWASHVDSEEARQALLKVATESSNEHAAPGRYRLAASRALQAVDPRTSNQALAELAASDSDPDVKLDAATLTKNEQTLRDLAADDDIPSDIRQKAEHLVALIDARRSVLRVGRVRRGIVALAGKRVGVIEETPGGGTRFVYDASWIGRPNARALGPSMPLRHAPYEDTTGLLPFFENLLPEGWLLNITRRKLGAVAGNPFGLLLATGGECVGAVEITPEPEDTGI